MCYEVGSPIQVRPQVSAISSLYLHPIALSIFESNLSNGVKYTCNIRRTV